MNLPKRTLAERNQMLFDKIRRYARLADSAWLRGDVTSFEYFSDRCTELLANWEG